MKKYLAEDKEGKFILETDLALEADVIYEVWEEDGDGYDSAITVDDTEGAIKASDLIEEDLKFKICKADEKEGLVYGIAMEPLVVDSQNDFEFSKEIQETAHDWMIKSRKMDLSHKKIIEDAKPVESFIAPVDFWFPGTPHDEEHKVRKNSWCVVTKVFNDSIFKDILNGKLNGYSIKGEGKRRPYKLIND